MTMIYSEKQKQLYLDISKQQKVFLEIILWFVLTEFVWISIHNTCPC